MSEYIIGGWTQDLEASAPESFSHAIYGMITNLAELKSGVPGGYGWSVAETAPPPQPSSSTKVMWAYGGAGCTPEGMPANDGEVEAIVQASARWAGVDIDDECAMNSAYINTTLKALKGDGKETSYTFIAGWAYNNPDQSPEGAATNEAVQLLADGGHCDRFILMCYGDAMWSMADIEANVGPALDRTIAMVKDPKRVILALTPNGLTAENRDYFLDQVTSKGVGGLFVWEWPDLPAEDLAAIQQALEIG